MNARQLTNLAAVAALLLVPSSLTRAGSDAHAPEAPDDRVVKVISIKGAGSSFLGIGVGEVDAERAKALGLREERGVEVKSVEKDSPAEKAGVKEGDVVLEYNGQRVEGTAQLIRYVQETPAGRQVTLLVSRGGGTLTLTPTIGTRKARVFFGGGGHNMEAIELDLERLRADHERALEELEEADLKGDQLERARRDIARAEREIERALREQAEMPRTPDAPLPPDEDFTIEIPEIPELPEVEWRSLEGLGVHRLMAAGPRLGIQSTSLTPQLADYFGVKDGVLVNEVMKGSAAEKAGIRAGDVITKVNGESIGGPGEVRSALRAAPRDKAFPVALVRKGKEIVVEVTLPAERSSTGPVRAPRAIRLSQGPTT